MANDKSISIVTTFYDGNKYIQGLYKNINEIYHLLTLSGRTDLEWVIVNDSTDIMVDKSDNEVGYNVKIINNLTNKGIHFSRVEGVINSTYEWVTFLDQDDNLIPEEYVNLIKLCGDDVSVVVGNGSNVTTSERHDIFKNKREMSLVIKEEMFLRGRNFIRSPGECLIRKKSIPEFWLANTLKINGADDWLLWLLFFNENKKFLFSDKIIYLHNQKEGSNLSFDYKKMMNSGIEMCELLENNIAYPKEKVDELRNTVEFRYAYLSKNITRKNIIQFIFPFIRSTYYLLRRKFI
jgi:glycosyltransferase involved in cell wall biosynthesis